MLLFGGNEFVASRNRCEFVVTDSAKRDFLRTGFGIEAPGTIRLNERDREWPVLDADVKGYRTVGIVTQAMHLLVFLNELFAFDLILARIMTGDQFGGPAKDFRDGLLIVALDGLEKSLTCLRGRMEGLLRGLLCQPRVSTIGCP